MQGEKGRQKHERRQCQHCQMSLINPKRGRQAHTERKPHSHTQCPMPYGLDKMPRPGVLRCGTLVPKEQEMATEYMRA